MTAKKAKVYVLKKDCPKIGKEVGDYYNGEFAESIEELIANGTIEEEVQEKPAKKGRAKKPKAAPVEELTKLPEEEKEPVQAIVHVPDGEVVVPKEFKTKLTRAQIEVIKEQFAKGASDTELQMFLYVCQRTGLDPFSKQIHLVPRYDGKLRKEVRGVVVGIDGLRSVAERTGNYAGNSDPIFGEAQEITVKETKYGADGRVESTQEKKLKVPSKATVTVKKAVAGVIAEFTATADWDEFYPGDKQGHMWRKMPKVMLGKCAEAKALRKAFPAVMSGLYVPEEMDQARLPDGSEAPVLTDFQKAEEMIGKTKDADGLEAMKGMIKISKKYTEDQKETLLYLMDQRIDVLRKDGVDEPA